MITVVETPTTCNTLTILYAIFNCLTKVFLFAIIIFNSASVGHDFNFPKIALLAPDCNACIILGPKALNNVINTGTKFYFNHSFLS